MTPGMWLAAIKDIIIVIAIIFIGWFVWHAGQQNVHVDDFKALQKNIQQNAQQEESWRADKSIADQKLASDVAKINSPGGVSSAPTKPVFVCSYPASSGKLPAHPGPTVDSGATTGTAVAGPGQGSQPAPVVFDARSQLEEFKAKYETSLAECRNMFDTWPKNTVLIK